MLILSGGFGTRLKPLVDKVPKALAPVGQVPFIYFQIEHWIAQGLKSFVFLLHHQADQIVKFLELEKNGLLAGCQVSWIVEPTPMDTGGAIAYAVQQLDLDGSFLVTNADTWVSKGFQEVSQSAAPSIAVLGQSNACRYGQVKFNKDFYITSFIEKNGNQSFGWINAGLCHLNANIFKNWDGQPFSLEKNTFPALAESGEFKAIPLQTDFIDIGIPRDYLNFCEWIASGKKNELQ